MEKTIRSFLLLLVITGMIFGGCSLYGEKETPVVEAEPEGEASEVVIELEEDINEGEDVKVSAVIPEGGELSVSGDGQVIDRSNSKYLSGGVVKTPSYATSGGQEEIEFRMEIEYGVVSDLMVIPKAKNETSKIHQEKFAEELENLVIGKSLDEIDVSVVNGSSLVSQAFNEVIEDSKVRFLN